MTLLSAEQILAADDITSEVVEVPEWGGSVRIAVMTAAARDEYDSYLYKQRDATIPLDNLRAMFISRCLVDENGKLLFTQAQMRDLGKKNSAVMQRLWIIAQKHNSVGVEGVEEAAKN